MSDSILCFGEIVWDALPGGLFLGGAPLNVAYHLRRHDLEVYPVSRIGEDFLGKETIRRLEASGLPLACVQTDNRHATGSVIVELDDNGDASYDIVHPAAWDFIELDTRLRSLASGAGMLVFGTLATRSSGNAAVLDDLLQSIPCSLCDVNLRHPHDDRDNALKWAAKADIVKMNEEELVRLVQAPAASSIADLAGRFAETAGVETVIVTRGGNGALLWHAGHVMQRPGKKVEVVDTVGAGDAFTAGFIARLQAGDSHEQALSHALNLGGFVAASKGAQPAYDPESVG